MTEKNQKAVTPFNKFHRYENFKKYGCYFVKALVPKYKDEFVLTHHACVPLDKYFEAGFSFDDVSQFLFKDGSVGEFEEGTMPIAAVFANNYLDKDFVKELE